MVFLLSSLFSWSHVHPILVHFTTALLPASLASDILGKFTNRNSLISAAWWMLLYGAIATPLTAFAGWMWAGDVQKMAGGEPSSILVTHQWLGTGLIAGFLILAIWRGRIFMLDKKPNVIYLVFAGVVV